jgi:hypothetical protein
MDKLNDLKLHGTSHVEGTSQQDLIILLQEERDAARMELLAYDALHGRIPLKQAAKLRQWGYLIKEDSIGKR